jgi:hypothetical protein
MILFFLGCLDPISNRLFFEDQEFLDALPSAKDERVGDVGLATNRSGDDEPTEPGDVLEAPPGAPALLALTVESVNGVNAMVDGFLGFVDAVREIPPSSREDDARTWGPWPADNAAAYDVRMVSTRQGVGEFTWSFDTAPHGTSDWSPFFWGVHFAAGVTVREGDGDFAFDGVAVDALDGSNENPFYLEAHYDHRYGNEVWLSVWPDRSLKDGVSLGEYHYAIDTDDAGTLTFDTSSPEFAAGDKVEQFHVTTNWIPDAGGNGDAVVSGGNVNDYFVDSVWWRQCWLPDGTLVYMADQYGITPPVGAPEKCPVPFVEP